MDEADIIKLFQERNEMAIESASSSYGRLLYTIAYAILGDHQKTEECLNDTYLQAWNAIPPAEPQSLSAYLGRITRNLAINLWHHDRAQKRFHPGDQDLEAFTQILTDSVTPFDTLREKELTASLNRWLAQLSPDDRILFIRRYWIGERVKDLAFDLKRPPKLLASHLYRLRQQLQQHLIQEGYIHETEANA